MGLLAGKWPNTLIYQPGGSTNVLTLSHITRIEGILHEFSDFVEEVLLGGRIERWMENKTTGELDGWLGEGSHANGDLGLFIQVAMTWA